MKDLMTELRISLVAVISLAIILCGIYPMLVRLCAKGLFPAQANGSLIMRSGKIAGSRLISQGFTDSRYFHPRPSSAGQGHDPAVSGGSNLGPISKKLVEDVKQRIIDFRRENMLPDNFPIPADAVTGSASGLDPHISVKNALLQAPCVAKMRGLSEKTVLTEIERYTEGRDLGFLGEPRVNVLMLNMELDKILK
jgi:potassium-transporting ATPase KdpC subunit